MEDKSPEVAMRKSYHEEPVNGYERQRIIKIYCNFLFL